MQTIGMAQRMNTTLNHQQIGHVLAIRDAAVLHNHNSVAYMPKPNTGYHQPAVGSQKVGKGLSCSDNR